jgi:hypothetical protein
MDITEIQSRVDALAKLMLAKALPQPEATVMVHANEQPCVHMSWGREFRTRKYEILRAETLAEAFEKAETFVASMPSPEEAKMREFMGAVGNAIEIGRANGIEVAFINPLTETMKKLSENIITHQKVAAE